MPRPIITDATLVSQAAVKLKREEKSELRKSTTVPHPKTHLLKPVKRCQKQCAQPIIRRLRVNQNTAKKRTMKHFEHDVAHWKRNVPVFRLKGVSLKALEKRKKNTAKDQAQAVMDEMVLWESDGASGVFQDEDGNTLVAYFARRLHDNLGVSDYSL